MHPVTVRHVGEDAVLVAAGALHDRMVAYWWGFDEDGVAVEQLSYLLVDEGVLLSQPERFPAEQQGWWYCDLVQVTATSDGYEFRDQYVDVIVGPPNHPYRVLDLDEYADAIAAGAMAPGAARDGLRRLQAFLDTRLNRRHETTQCWPNFPPAACTAVDPAGVPRQWTWELRER